MSRGPEYRLWGLFPTALGGRRIHPAQRLLVDGHRLDIRHETERRGRPYTLICTKTRRAYERRCSRYTDDIAHMRLLITAEPGANAAYQSKLQQLRAAVARQEEAGDPTQRQRGA